MPIVSITSFSTADQTIAALRLGAWDFVAKPINDLDDVLATIDRVSTQAGLKTDRDRRLSQLEKPNRALEEEVLRQNQDLQAHSRELAALNRVSYAISDLLDLDTMLHHAIDAAMAAIEADDAQPCDHLRRGPGIGIPPEQLEYIFDRFYQANGSSRRRYGGTGLGLAIAGEICNAHGGTLEVKSAAGKGSIFAVVLPRASQPDTTHTAPNRN